MVEIIFDRNKLGGRFTVQGIAVRDVKPDSIVLDIVGPSGARRPSEFFSPEVARKLAFDILDATGGRS